MNATLSRTPVVLAHASGASAAIDPQGAHVLSWSPTAGDERLFLSERSIFADGVAIRGGVPVIFPQFAGEGPLPKHGFARNRRWQLTEQQAHSARWQLQSDAQTLALWPHRFACELAVTLADRELLIELSVENTDSQSQTFTAALHSYLRVGEIGDVRIEGLQGLRYRDSTQGTREFDEAAASVAIAGEVDRIYFDAPASLRLRDGERRLRIEQSGFVDTVVWNPGAERGAALADLEPGGFRRMLCIEAATVGRPVTLQPGQRWSGSQRLVAER